MSRALGEIWQQEMWGGVQPVNGGSGTAFTPNYQDGGSVWQFTLTGAATISAPTNPPPAGSTLTLVLIQGGAGGYAVTWATGAGAFRNAPAQTAGAAGTRASSRWQYDGVSWQFIGGSSVFA